MVGLELHLGCLVKPHFWGTWSITHSWQIMQVSLGPLPQGTLGAAAYVRGLSHSITLSLINASVSACLLQSILDGDEYLLGHLSSESVLAARNLLVSFWDSCSGDSGNPFPSSGGTGRRGVCVCTWLLASKQAVEFRFLPSPSPRLPQCPTINMQASCSLHDAIVKS